MTELEKRSSQRARRGQLQRSVLSVLALTGIAGLAIAAPNTLQLLRKRDLSWIGTAPHKKLRAVAHQLKKKGYIEWVHEGGRIRMRITNAGRRYLDRALLGTMIVQKPKRWDGKWRLVIFDIAESRRALRNKVRGLVAGFGFVRLQDSIWAYPYACEEVITLLKTELSIGRELLYIIADEIEYDAPLRKHFGLPHER